MNLNEIIDAWEDFCSCCGRLAPKAATWCDGCLAHIIPGHSSPYLATFEAKTGQPCPYAEFRG